MSLGSEVGGKVETAGHRLRQRSSFSSEFIPYLLATTDAFVILSTSILAGIAYQVGLGNEIPNFLPHAAVGLLASFIYILRMSGSGHYDFPGCAKPQVEIANILVCWFTTGLLLAFFAFLLKIGVAYSRGAFVLFYFFAPVGLLGVRKVTKSALASAMSRGSVGRKNVVLVGDFNEVAALQAQDGAFLLGEMAEHTSNAGMIYFAAGTPDPSDLAGDAVDLAASVLREMEEETGLAPADVTIAEGWTAVIHGPRIAMMRRVRSSLQAIDLKGKIETFLASDPHAELSRMHIVARPSDIRPEQMPLFQRAYLEHRLALV